MDRCNGVEAHSASKWQEKVHVDGGYGGDKKTKASYV